MWRPTLPCAMAPITNTMGLSLSTTVPGLGYISTQNISMPTRVASYLAMCHGPHHKHDGLVIEHHSTRVRLYQYSEHMNANQCGYLPCHVPWLLPQTRWACHQAPEYEDRPHHWLWTMCWSSGSLWAGGSRWGSWWPAGNESMTS